ncbi:glutaminase [Polaribacter porphyrae]|uniref:Glutaminase n=1 Tax=Polaribacter porphyrae TaxID=1137780 RepID=A0A2S7WTF3_9FLAO|nr:glutaminase [Polaribacter porphyrae]PQJ80746.1 glutaminase [Polaribacter porphyrae]
MKSYHEIIETTYKEVKKTKDKGKIATYIPELGNVSSDNFGASISTIDDKTFGVGNCDEKFSIQSISKILTLTLAYKLEGEKLWERVDVEPSGNPFNSLQQLDADKGKPRNPFINAGAIVICDVLVSRLENPKEDFLKFCREVADNDTINYCEKVAQSEKETGFRNFALCNFIKSFDNIKNDVDKVLDFYFYTCSLEMSCKELSETFLYLTEDNFSTCKGNRVLSKSEAKRVNAIMLTCGFYDESGEFAFRVGLPGKSGVGGGIIAIHPNEYCIAVWSPKLNPKGNSYKGMLFLEKFTSATTSSIF